MHSGKLSLGKWIAAGSAIVLMIFIGYKIMFKSKDRLSSARLIAGQGSSGSIAHKTWTQYGGGADQSKYVDLKEITKQNVTQLQIAWEYPTKDNSSYRFNPIIVDNVMYVLAKNNSLVVSATGAVIDKSKPEAEVSGRYIVFARRAITINDNSLWFTKFWCSMTRILKMNYKLN